MNDYIQLVASKDNSFPLLNMEVQLAKYEYYTQPSLSPVPIEISDSVSRSEEPLKLSSLTDEFMRTILDSTITMLEKSAYKILKNIKDLDLENADKYLYYMHGYLSSCNFGINALSPLTNEAINRFSMSISSNLDLAIGKSVSFYIEGLYINKKYDNVGSSILNIVKSQLKSLVELGQYAIGYIELYSVETAVLFYLKNGFFIKELFMYDNEPQTKVHNTHNILKFALKERNINIMKRFAKVTQENFLEFIEYLMKNTTYGKFFRAYYDNLENKNEIERSVMESKFIGSLFSTNMVYKYSRDITKQRVTLKRIAI